ncbi:MAG: signal peptidase II [Alphaproteobacteria bacterium]|nr:signal peptidase II [Alphaproteobacteria bacterium]
MADLARELWQRLLAPGAARLGLVLAAGIILADQISKWFVLNVLNLSPQGCLEFQLASPAERAFLPNTCERIEISGIFDLTMVWNKGVSFGLLGADNMAGRLLLIGFSLAVAGYLIAGLLGYGALKAERQFQALAFGMIVGGALGNVVDRIFFGAVVDFFDFSGLGFPWVFNIADVSINVGVGLIILDMLLEGREKRPS